MAVQPMPSKGIRPQYVIDRSTSAAEAVDRRGNYAALKRCSTRNDWLF
jgi:hypothetical protein